VLASQVAKADKERDAKKTAKARCEGAADRVTFSFVLGRDQVSDASAHGGIEEDATCPRADSSESYGSEGGSCNELL
jgi:hypothetical protein